MTIHRSALAAAQPTDRAAALLVSRDQELIAAVREINGLVSTVGYEQEDDDPGWERIGDGAGLLVLIPSLPVVLAGATKPLSLLVTRNLDDAQVGRRAVNWNAGHVIVLPDGGSFLGGYLARHLTD